MSDFKAGTKAMKGVINTYVVWRGDGHGVVTTVTASKADAAATQAQVVWSGVAGLLKTKPVMRGGGVCFARRCCVNARTSGGTNTGD